MGGGYCPYQSRGSVQKAFKLDNLRFDRMPPLARLLGFNMTREVIGIHGTNFGNTPFQIPQNHVVPANLRTISDMIKDPFPGVEIL